jgi:hypothetical protein
VAEFTRYGAEALGTTAAVRIGITQQLTNRAGILERARAAAAESACPDIKTRARLFPAQLMPLCPQGHPKNYRWAGDGVYRCRLCMNAASVRTKAARRVERIERTHCPRGHVKDYRTPGGWLSCRVCMNAASQRYRERQRASGRV